MNSQYSSDDDSSYASDGDNSYYNTNYRNYTDINNHNNIPYTPTRDEYATAQIYVSHFNIDIEWGSASTLPSNQQQEASISTNEQVNYSSVIE